MKIHITNGADFDTIHIRRMGKEMGACHIKLENGEKHYVEFPMPKGDGHLEINVWSL